MELKLVIFHADGELRRVGKNYQLKHYLGTYGEESIHVVGYLAKGNSKKVDMELEIVISEDNLEYFLHDVVMNHL
ncbi:MAG: hypothetical protein INQ03_07965 [Candidatus Heimdallarchaeota archaeon]|nr:hypothetical protein [Candidatus Heimdallarchaeota archaeon]